MKNKTVSIICVRNKEKIADQCLVAESFLSRFMGLMGKRFLKEGQGLWLRPCSDIHMWFMKIPIDVVFIKAHSVSHNYYQVTSIKENIKPWTLFPVFDFKASSTLELPAGIIQKTQVRKGDILCIN